MRAYSPDAAHPVLTQSILVLIFIGAAFGSSLIATAAVADAARELARCKLEAERLYPVPDNKGFENAEERRLNEEKRAGIAEQCMRAANYQFTDACTKNSEVFFQSCLQSADEQMPAEAVPNEKLRRETCGLRLREQWSWNRLRADCYQSVSRWRRFFGK